MGRDNTLRIIANGVCLFSAIFLPVYVTFFLLIILNIVLVDFLESIFWAFFLDTLYGKEFFFGTSIKFSLLAIIIVFFLVSTQLKKVVIFNSRS